MSRLDSAIRRLQAQRACLGAAARLIAGLDGPVLELGLGNGRTYDHLRDLFPDREIFVFDRQVNAHPDCTPDAAHLILGDIRQTLPGAFGRIGSPAAFAHCDIGTGRAEADEGIAAVLAGSLSGLLAPGAVVAADQHLDSPSLVPLELPAEVAPGRYFMYRADTS